EPLLTVVTERREGVWTVGRKRTTERLAVRSELHLRHVERTVVVRALTTTATIGDIGAGQARIVSIQAAVGVEGRNEPLASEVLGYTQLETIVVANCLGLNGARRAEWSGETGGVQSTMQHVSVSGSGVADVEAERVAGPDIFYRIVEALACVASGERQGGRNSPVRTYNKLMLLHGLDVGIDARV